MVKPKEKSKPVEGKEKEISFINPQVVEFVKLALKFHETNDAESSVKLAINAMESEIY